MSKTLPTPIKRWEQLMTQRKLGSNAITVFDVEVNYDAFIKFIQQALELWMLIPTDKDGKPMEMPEKFDRWTPGMLSFSAEVFAKCREYQEALDRRLFEGWSLNPTGYAFCLGSKKGGIISYDSRKYTIDGNRTVEDLIDAKIELTPTERVIKDLKL